MKVTLQFQEDHFLPVHSEDVDYCSKLKPNSVFVVDVKRSRNPQFHRYAFKMLHNLYDMIDTPFDFDSWRRLLTTKAGYFTVLSKVDIKGTVQTAIVPDSLNFESMDNDEFRKCFLAIHQAFCDKHGDLLTEDQLFQWAQI